MPRLILGWHTMDIQDMDGVVGQHGELGVDIMGNKTTFEQFQELCMTLLAYIGEL